MQKCPKCQYERTTADHHVMEGICPACGIAYSKWKDGAPVPPSISVLRSKEARYGFRRKLWGTLTYIPERVDGPTFWGRCVLLGIFVVWGASFMFHGLDWEYIGGSFMHNVNLAFHEFGHVLFMPFGRFMTILGGSLFQIMMPLIALFCFSLQRRDNFAAALMLWWTGQSFIDVAPYIADAKYRSLPLILGMGEEFHDWGNLLTMLNRVDAAGTYANIAFGLGCILMLLSFYWAGWVLWQQKKIIDEHGEFSL
jgi:hypothetical protein